MRPFAWLAVTAFVTTSSFASIAHADEKLEGHRGARTWGLLLEGGLALGSQTTLQGRSSAFSYDVSIEGNVWLSRSVALGLHYGDGDSASIGGCSVESSDPQMNCLTVRMRYLEPEILVASEWFHRGPVSLGGMLSASIGWARKGTYLTFPGDVYAGGTPDKLLMEDDGVGASTSASIDLRVYHLEARATLRARTEVGNYSVGPYLAVGVSF
ncbi:hypothetical protein BH11MYX2_BH11MYX2_27590 [soil metagenome]